MLYVYYILFTKYICFYTIYNFESVINKILSDNKSTTFLDFKPQKKQQATSDCFVQVKKSPQGIKLKVQKNL